MFKGNSVFIRTVTNYYTGKIVRVTKSWIVLSDATWIADTGRFSEFLARGVPNEAEQIPGLVHVARGAIVDVITWSNALPVPTR